MFTNYPLAVQILIWGVFMGLNGYIGATCPGLNLAILALAGLFANRGVGIILLIAAIIITAAESVWFILNSFAAGMSAIPQGIPSLLEQGTGILNVIAAVVTFIVLLYCFGVSLPGPKWLVIGVVSLFYLAGASSGIMYWCPGASHFITILLSGLLFALCFTGWVPFAAITGGILFLILAIFWGIGITEWAVDKIKYTNNKNLTETFVKAVQDNQQGKIEELFDSVDKYAKRQALFEALKTGNQNLVNLFVKKGVYTGEIMSDSIRNEDLEKVKMLVKAGVPVTTENVRYAAEYDNLPAVKFFVENGADINAEELFEIPLYKAAEEGKSEILTYLLNTGKNSQKSLNAALTVACSRLYNRTKEGEENIKLLLKYGAQANNHDGYDNVTPLHGAAGYGTLEIVKLLVSKGADVNAVNDNGTTALMPAVEEDKIETVKFLLQQGAGKTINQIYKTEHGTPAYYTPLFRAKSAEMVQLLLDNGAKTSYKDNTGATVLLRSIYQRKPEIVKILLKTDVNINEQDNKGQTALLCAVKDTFYESSQIETVKLLLKSGADVNLADDEGNTPLIAASSEELLQLLLDHGADVKAVNKRGETALIRAANQYDPEGKKAEILLKHGTDVNARDKNGKTALGYATGHNGSWDSDKRNAVLIRYGAEK